MRRVGEPVIATPPPLPSLSIINLALNLDLERQRTIDGAGPPLYLQRIAGQVGPVGSFLVPCIPCKHRRRKKQKQAQVLSGAGLVVGGWLRGGCSALKSGGGETFVGEAETPPAPPGR